MTKRTKSPFDTSFPEGFTVSEDFRVTDPHPEGPAPVGAYAPSVSPGGLAYVQAYWKWKLAPTTTCSRCGGPRFASIYDTGAGYGPSGAQIGICGRCGEDLKLARPRRRKLASWEGG